MSRKYGTAVAAVAVLIGLAIHFWLLRTGTKAEALQLFSFSLLCLLASWLIGVIKQRSAQSSSTALHHSIEIASRQDGLFLTSGAARPLRNALTVDLEDYFHTEVAAQVVDYSEWDRMPSRIRSTVSRLLDLLDEHETKATVFVLGWIADRYPSLIREVAERGHEIGCHSYRHRLVFRLSQAMFREDTRMALVALENATGLPVHGYRAPSFSITPGTEWAFDTLADLGFQYDSSVHPVRHKTYGNPTAPRHPYVLSRSRLLEVPIATRRIAGTNLPMGGGAYLRILPYSYVHAGLAHINRAELQPATIYVHPWEIDVFQPPLGLKWQSRLRQNWGIQRMEGRLSNLLSSFQFAPVSEVHSHLLPASKPNQRAYVDVELLLKVAN